MASLAKCSHKNGRNGTEAEVKSTVRNITQQQKMITEINFALASNTHTAHSHPF